MKWIDLTYDSPAENLACDEALLDHCEEGGEGEILRFWEPSAFFVVLGALSVVTMGFAMLCIQPLFILLIPLFLLVMALMEQSESAIVADELNVTSQSQSFQS